MTRQQVPLVKIIVAGASQAGKTSLVHKFVFDKFIDVSPTVGINFAQKICNGEAGPLNMSIWDLSGQNRFRFLMPKFLSGATGVILVIDQTRPDTLTMGAEWLNLINQYAHSDHKEAIVLAGAKTDLPSHIAQDLIHRFCREFNVADFVPCSSKEGTNVVRVFERVATAIRRSAPDAVTTPSSVQQSL